MNKYFTYTFTILLTGITLLVSCTSTKNLNSPKPVKNKCILGKFELDSLSKSIHDSIYKTLIHFPDYSNSIILSKRHQFLYEVPNRGDNGHHGNRYRKGNWDRNSDTLFLSFGLPEENTTEEAYLFRADSLIPIDLKNRKIWIKNKKYR